MHQNLNTHTHTHTHTGSMIDQEISQSFVEPENTSPCSKGHVRLVQWVLGLFCAVVSRVCH